MSRKLKVSDEVVVIAGNDRGKVGKILAFRQSRVVVEGVNMRKKHMKPTQQNQKGQIITIECPIDLSNVKPSIEGKGVKLRVKESGSGERELYYNDGKKQVAYRSVKKQKK